MKEFTEFRTELNEGIEDLVEHVTMPPNILILRRKTVRQFPDGVMVALYYNDKLGLQFSIPYGPTQNPVVTPVGLEEKTAPMGIPDYKAPMGIDKNKAPMGIPTRTKWHYGKQPQVLDLQNLDEEAAEHGVIQRLRNIKDFHAIKHITHADGSTTHVDPTTAHALLTVHDALHPDNQKKFADHLGHSAIKFNRMVDFAWKSVK